MDPRRCLSDIVDEVAETGDPLTRRDRCGMWPWDLGCGEDVEQASWTALLVPMKLNPSSRPWVQLAAVMVPPLPLPRRRWGEYDPLARLNGVQDTYGRTYLVYHRIYEDSS